MSEVVNASSLNSFKNRLDRFWMNQDILYIWHADLTKTGSGSIVSDNINPRSSYFTKGALCMRWTQRSFDPLFVYAYGRIRNCRHLANTIELSVCGVDAPYGMSNYFDRLLSLASLLRDSRTDSRALRAEYCIMGIPHNTAI